MTKIDEDSIGLLVAEDEFKSEDNDTSLINLILQNSFLISK